MNRLLYFFDDDAATRCTICNPSPTNLTNIRPPLRNRDDEDVVDDGILRVLGGGDDDEEELILVVFVTFFTASSFLPVAVVAAKNGIGEESAGAVVTDDAVVVAIGVGMLLSLFVEEEESILVVATSFFAVSSFPSLVEAKNGFGESRGFEETSAAAVLVVADLLAFSSAATAADEAIYSFVCFSATR